LKPHFFGVYKRFIEPLKLTHHIVVWREVNGIKIKLNLSDWVQTNLFFLGGYEKTELDFVMKNLPKDALVIDVGANIGWYSLNLSRFLNQGQVISFEPFSKNYLELQSNLEANRLKNIQVFRVGLGNVNEKLQIRYNSDDHNLGMASINLATYDYSEDIEVKRLDDFDAQMDLKKLKFIKLDIEGFEYEALLGMSETLKTYKPYLLIEQDENVLQSKSVEIVQKMDDFLRALGYQKFLINKSGTLVKVNYLTSKEYTNYFYKV
jgi:FkbM family methyltransferase